MNIRCVLRRLLAAACAAALLAAVCIFACSRYVTSQSAPYILQSIDELPACDAILVLGARVYDNNQPSPTLADRLDSAIALYRAGKAKKILASGDHSTAEYDEVSAMLAYLLAHDIPVEDIFLDHAGLNTYDSLYRARDIFQAESLLICTQDFHMPRAIYIARSLGISAWGVPCPDRQTYREYNRLRESLARVKAVIETDVLRREPRFLGPAIPLSGDGRSTHEQG